MRKNKYIFLPISLLAHWFIGSFVFSQSANPGIDSLLRILKIAKKDTNEVNVFNLLAKEMELTGEYEKGINYAAQAKRLAQKLNFKKGIADACGNFGNLYYRQDNYPEALNNHFASLKIYEALDNKPGISKRLGNIGIIYYEQGDNPKALDYYFKALKMKEALADKTGVTIVLGNIGIIYYEQGDYPKALDCYFKALKMNEELGRKTGISKCLGNIGNIYYEQGDYPKALDCYLKSLKIKETLGDKAGITHQLGNIGNIYQEQGNYPGALDYYCKALMVAEETGSKKGIAKALYNIGCVYSAEADKITANNNSIKKDSLKQKALIYYFKALKIYEELGEKDGIASVFGNIGLLYIDTKKYAEAEKFLLNALKLDKQTGALLEEMNVENYFTRLYAQTNRHQLALEHYKKAMALKDTLFNADKDKEITRKEMSYEFEKKEAAAKAEQEKKDAVQKSESGRQRVVLIFTSGFLVLVLVFAGFIFRALSITRKQKQLIEQQKKIVEEKQKEILDSIHYARRIQTALLPTEKYIDKTLKRLMKK
ncbi:MAG: tetratricopeptide repeat protein [Bacteroidetes bacterium]|nr:MAG: tetratricopeptide repeat protein [Bacteroidota bacterium]